MSAGLSASSGPGAATGVSELAEMLAEHQSSGTISSREGWTGCQCGAKIPVPGGFDSSGYPLDWDAEEDARNRHVAEVIAASGVVPAAEVREQIETLETVIGVALNDEWIKWYGSGAATDGEVFNALVGSRRAATLAVRRALDARLAGEDRGEQ